MTADAIAAPLSGGSAADRLTDAVAVNQHGCYNNVVSLVAGTTYTWSCFLKNNLRRYAYLLLDTGTNNIAFFDLQAGAVGSASRDASRVSSIASSLVPIGGADWYRASMRVTMIASVSVFPFVGLSNDGAATSYLGDGSSLYAWGAQFTRANWEGPYVRTTNAFIGFSSAIRNLVANT